jgi:hypothetical protein
MNQFKQKELSINAAIERVKIKLAYFEANKHNQDFKEWNNWHDLEDRLIDRLKDNWSAFKDWHFTQFGFNTY